MDDDLIETLKQILAVYSISILIIGTISNICCFCVFMRKSLRKIPTFVFLSFIHIFDSMTLYFWNLDHFLLPFYGYMIEFRSIHTCRLSTFMQLFSLQCSAWLLVIMCIDRYLSVRFTTWRKSFLNEKKAVIVSIILVSCIFLLNIHLTMTISYDGLENYPYPDKCFVTDMFLMWKKVHTYLYSVVPFVILAITNALLITQTLLFRDTKKLGLSASTSQSSSNKLGPTISVISITLSFIILTLPNAIAGGYYITELFKTSTGTLILFITDCLLFTYHSCNLVVLLIFNKMFRKEFKSMIGRIQKGKSSIHPITVSTHK